MQTSWFKNGHEYHYGEVSNQIDVLPVGIYNIKVHPITGKIHLCRVEDNFKFNHKIYGLEKDFIQRVQRTYDSVNDNLGILLNGIRGTGKSVTAKQICNILNLPVIIVDGKYDALPTFISELQQNVVVFIDEYEKIYKEDSDILTVMDGIFKTGYKHVFLLTTNDLYINKNMLQRPGRIRYVKTYEDLSPEIVEEIVDDMLVNKQHKTDCINSISKLEIITVDLVKSIIQEVNIHDEEPSKFIDFFNVKDSQSSYRYTIPVNLLLVENGIVTDKYYAQNINLEPIKSIKVGHTIYHEDQFMGRIVDKYSNNMLKIYVGYNELEPDPEDYDEKGKFIESNYNADSLIKQNGKYYIKTTSINADIKSYFVIQVKLIENTHANYKQITGNLLF